MIRRTENLTCFTQREICFASFDKNELFNRYFGKGCYLNNKLLSENVDKFEHNDERNTAIELHQS